MKLIAKKLTIRNFLSVGNVPQNINLNTNLLTLILGVNLDSEAGTRNGAGKTTILQAISYAIYGKPLTRIRLPNLLNNINGKNMVVTFEFSKGETSYRIERGQRPAFLRFYVNDNLIKQDAGIDEAQGENTQTQGEITNRVFGMSHLMFKHIVGMNTFTEPFLKERDAVQRAIIEELLGITQLSQRAEILRDRMAVTKESIRDQEARIKAITETNSRIDIALKNAEDAERAWLRGRDASVAKIRSEIAALAEIDFDAEIAAFDAVESHAEKERGAKTTLAFARQQHDQVRKTFDPFSREVTRHKAALAALDEDKATARLDTEIKRKILDLSRHDTQIAKFMEQKAAAIEALAKDDHQVCTCCGQDLAGTDHLMVLKANLAREIEELEAKIGRETTERLDREREIEGITDDKTQIVVTAAKQRAIVQKQIADAISEAMSHEHALIGQTKVLEAALAAMNDLGPRPTTIFDNRAQAYAAREMRNTLERDLETEISRANPYVEQIEALRSTLQKIDYTALNEATTLLKHQDFLLKLLTSKDSFIRKKIVDQNLSYLTGRLGHYLGKLALPHEVVFQSDLTVDIRHLGRDYDFEQLSRGEMNRVIMATSWAFRDVWEGLNHHVNLLWVDEMLDQGTDTQGVEAALGILKSMARDRGKNVFLVSHREDLKSRIDSILLVRKENEFTSFEQNAIV